MSKIHVWLGYTPQSEAEFYNYFSVSLSGPETEFGASQFDKDTGQLWYDDDFIGTWYAGSTPDLAACLAELPTSPAVTAQIEQAYRQRHLPPPNAMFYYTDAELVVADPARTFNHLNYMGIFEY